MSQSDETPQTTWDRNRPDKEIAAIKYAARMEGRRAGLEEAKTLAEAAAARYRAADHAHVPEAGGADAVAEEIEMRIQQIQQEEK